MAGPLTGVKVLSFGRVLAGPYAAMLMADLGAEVFKIEDREKGDMARNNGPFIKDVSSYFLSVNRGKKSVGLNMRHDKAQKLLLKLIGTIDILVENFRPGVMKKMGLDYDSLKELNPGLVYVSISGFGQYGPYAQKPAFDMIAQGMGGTVSITGEADRPPVRVGYSIGDIGAALYAVTAAMAALYEREKTGLGQQVDVAMLDCQVALCENACARYFATGEVPRPLGSRHPIVTPFQVFPTKTDDMVVITFRDEEWRNLCRVIGREEWIEDERFNTSANRTEHHAELEPLLVEIFKQKTRDEWLNLLEQQGIVVSPVNNIQQAVSDPHVLEREMILAVDHSRLGKVNVVGTPMKFSRTPCRIEKASPDLGEHTAEFLEEWLGLSPEEIDSLRVEKVI
ncbi:MAG: CoA transferase [Deltaproteobacteria bacterium]|nr:CoA transferase [Deltaproteobacteria bacterium]